MLYVMLCYVMLYVMLCYVIMLCYMLCYYYSVIKRGAMFMDINS